ncbi:MAG: PEGA domain-containing protein [Chitinivibrionales bacterium]|nr:PEGA domain-containing protein [Chitinivibrionales bacterium]MBD3397048.1 PEGA domain-containing protein [Chitinivibrionales bacterium]
MNHTHGIDDLYAYFKAQLRKDVSDAHIDYDAVFASLSARMSEADDLGPLAQLKRYADLPEETWERIEQGLARRIAEYNEYEEPVDECIAGDAPVAGDRWRKMESSLFNRIDRLEKLPAWEQVLKTEEQLPEGQWEKIEANLMARVQAHEDKPRFVWPVLWLRSSTMVRAAAALIIAVVAGLGGYTWYQNAMSRLPTWAYQAQGANADMVGSIDPFQERFGSADGGAVQLVNRHGYVHLRNGASVAVERATDRVARYRLRMKTGSSGEIVGGKATFFVARNTQRKRFEIVTDEYRIQVVGTYFRVLPDLAGRVSTEVLEGSVVVHSDFYGNLRAKAGQSIVYDPGVGRYIVRSGGPVIAREDVDDMPDLEAIAGYRVLTIHANVEFCDVSIDGRYRGMTPLNVLVPRGRHTVRVSRDDYVAVDTSVTVTEEEPYRLYAVMSTGLPSQGPAAEPSMPPHRAAPKQPSMERPETGEKGRERELAEEQLLARAQQAERRGWRKGIRAYEALLEAENVSPLVKQTALFSIGKLQAEHAGLPAARESFLRYLALYPGGVFARESLLRLAEIEFESDPDKAIGYYRRYFERYPNHYRVPELQYRVGLILMQQKKYDEAVYMFKQSLANMLYDDAAMRKRIYASLHKAMVAQGDVANAEMIYKHHLDTSGN